jgi:hypothetical protein
MTVIAWTHRSEALPPSGVVTQGDATQRLLAQLRLRSAEELARLTLVATRDLLVLMGASDDLPWVDGARYCAPDPAAQTLWLPTTLLPSIPVDLLRRSASARVGERAVLLWHEPEQFLPLHPPRSLTLDLIDWIARESQ